MIDLEAIEAREKAATPGPWEHGEVTDEDDGESAYDVSGPASVQYASDYVGFAEADAAFIARARQDVPALVAEVRRLRAELAAAEGRQQAAVAAALEEFLACSWSCCEEFGQAVHDGLHWWHNRDPIRIVCHAGFMRDHVAAIRARGDANA